MHTVCKRVILTFCKPAQKLLPHAARVERNTPLKTVCALGGLTAHFKPSVRRLEAVLSAIRFLFLYCVLHKLETFF